MQLDPAELLKLIGNGGGLIAFVVLVYYMIKQGEKREERCDERATAHNKSYDALKEAIDGIRDDIRDLSRPKG